VPDATLVVIPTYNEADNVDVLLDGIAANAPDVHVLFVDDNSTDGTRAVIRARMAAEPGRIFLMERERKLGLGTAYVAAFKWALARGYPAVVEMDADLSHRPVDLARLLAELKERPVVVGSRYVKDGGTENWGVGRRIISQLGSLYARTILRMRTRDLTGGFNGWQRAVLDAIRLDDVRSEGYAFQIELKYRAHLAGYPIHELPILFVERRAGQSKMSYHIVTEAIGRVWVLAALRREIIRARLTGRPRLPFSGCSDSHGDRAAAAPDAH
jgi:dolichol-phosphate mannosyltransferase